MNKVEVFRTAGGKFKARLLDASGSIVPIHAGSVGGTQPAKERAANRAAVQATLRSMYERQQAGSSGR